MHDDGQLIDYEKNALSRFIRIGEKSNFVLGHL